MNENIGSIEIDGKKDIQRERKAAGRIRIVG